MRNSTLSYAARHDKNTPGPALARSSPKSEAPSFPQPAHPLSQLKTGGDAQLAALVFGHFADPSSRTQKGVESKQQLPLGVGTQMEQSFGCSFSDVTIYPDSPLAQEHGAQAVTRGNELHFGRGHYDPASQTGRQLIGHELAHVVQQRSGQVPGGAGSVNSDAGLEAQAEAHGIRAAAGHAVSPQQAAGSAPATTAAPIQCRKPGDDPLGKTNPQNQHQGGSGGANTEGGIEKKERESLLEEPLRTTWKKELGKFLGGSLYDLVVKNLEGSDLESYFKDGVDSILKSVLEHAKNSKPVQAAIHEKGAPTLPGKSPEQLFDAMAKSLQGTINNAAASWAKTPVAKRLFSSVSGAVKNNPNAVIAVLPMLILSAAAIAYANNWNPPAIKPTIPIGHSGVSVTPQLDLGPMPDIMQLRSKAVEAIGLDVQIHKPGFDVSVGVEHKNEEEGLLHKTFAGTTNITGSVTLRLGSNEPTTLDGLLTFDPHGKTAKLKLSSEWQHKIPGKFLNGTNTKLLIKASFHGDFGDKPSGGGGIQLSLENQFLKFGASYNVNTGPMIHGGGLDHAVMVTLDIHF